MKWDLNENVPDMTGKNILITGCSSGIGLEAASQLLSRHATIVMACRNKTKMESVATSLCNKHGLSSSSTSNDNTRIIQLELDVSDLDSVRAFPSRLREAGVTSLYGIILNAGIVTQNFKLSAQRIESTFATNVLGHWLLTSLLLPYIQDVPNSRVVVVSSVTHFLQFSLNYPLILAGVKSNNDDNLKNIERKYDGRRIYAQTKLANHWFVAELNRRLEKHENIKTVAVVAHPGYADTAMTAPSSGSNVTWLSAKILHFLGAPFRQTGEQGAWPLVYAVTDHAISNHFHYGPKMFELWGVPIRDSYAAPQTGNVEKQCELWEECERLCGKSYPI